jgi:hypothetical protein
MALLDMNSSKNFNNKYLRKSVAEIIAVITL